MKSAVIKLGGSLVVPDEIDVDFLSRFRKLAADFATRGNQLVLIVGGGKICRRYQDAARALRQCSNDELDWLGIYSTWLNACLVKTAFGKLCQQEVIRDYTKLKINSKSRIIVGAGGVPGHSTNLDAVNMALAIHSELIINLTDQYFVYTADPRKDSSAKPLKKLTWSEYLRIIDSEWRPGLSAPFDPVASRLAQKQGLSVIVTKGSDLRNLGKILRGKEFKGTIIS